MISHQRYLRERKETLEEGAIDSLIKGTIIPAIKKFAPQIATKIADNPQIDAAIANGITKIGASKVGQMVGNIASKAAVKDFLSSVLKAGAASALAGGILDAVDGDDADDAKPSATATTAGAVAADDSDKKQKDDVKDDEKKDDEKTIKKKDEPSKAFKPEDIKDFTSLAQQVGITDRSKQDSFLNDLNKIAQNYGLSIK